MPQPISVLNLFTTYGTRDAYKASTGKDTPAWNQTRPPKYWEDPKAVKKGMMNGVPVMIYDRVYAGFDQAAGEPLWDMLILPVEEAKTVNIPPTGDGMTNVPGADQDPVPCPVRELQDGEIVKLEFGAIPKVYNADELQDVAVGFCQRDRDMLERIAAKLGV